MLRENLEKAQARISAFQKEKGIVARDEQLDGETARLNELSRQLTAIAGADDQYAKAGSAPATPRTRSRKSCKIR